MQSKIFFCKFGICVNEYLTLWLFFKLAELEHDKQQSIIKKQSLSIDFTWLKMQWVGMLGYLNMGKYITVE